MVEWKKRVVSIQMADARYASNPLEALDLSGSYRTMIAPANSWPASDVVAAAVVAQSINPAQNSTPLPTKHSKGFGTGEKARAVWQAHN